MLTCGRLVTAIAPYLMIAAGFAWLAADLYFLAGDTMLRETRLAIIARFLDSIATIVSTPIFILLWAGLLLGWTIPVAVGFTLLANCRPPTRSCDAREFKS